MKGFYLAVRDAYPQESLHLAQQQYEQIRPLVNHLFCSE
jgi:hypothetical protein